jgi:hypothetical protein
MKNPSSSSRSWKELATGPPHRVWFGFAEGAGKLFVVNGMTDSSKLEGIVIDVACYSFYLNFPF